MVFRAQSPGQPDLVLKQSLAKLRVQQDWFSDRARIFREIDALTFLQPLAPPGSLPTLLFEDRPHYLFAMSAADESAPTWKQLLLAGQVDTSLALQAAQLQKVFFEVPHLESQFTGLDLFDQLRLDPYYRATARAHPDLSPQFEAAIHQSRNELRGLTHGDWSPKNFLVNPGNQLFSIDYEVMHWGDPSFDVAFLLNHFLLKCWHNSLARPLYAQAALTYFNELKRSQSDWIEAATLRHLGCLHLARIDGKSPAEYLRPHERDQARRFARDLIQHPPPTIAEVFEMQADSFHE